MKNCTCFLVVGLILNLHVRLSDDADEQQPLKTKQQGKVVDHLKSELKALLNQPLLPKGTVISPEVVSS